MVHRALMARMPEALEATLHPDATRAVAEFLCNSMVFAREAGRVMPQCVMPFAGASPPITGVAHRMEALPRVAISLRVEVGRNRSSRAAFALERRARWPWYRENDVVLNTTKRWPARIRQVEERVIRDVASRIRMDFQIPPTFTEWLSCMHRRVVAG